MRTFSRHGAARHARLQSVLAIAAIATAVSLPVMLISVGGGVADAELRTIQNAGYQIVVSAPGDHELDLAHNASRQLLGISDVAAASPVLSIAVDAFFSALPSNQVLAEGVIPAQFAATLGSDRSLFPNPLPLGDPTDEVHFANGSYTGRATDDVLVSFPFASDAGIRVGESLLLSPSTDKSLGVSFAVTGIFGVPEGPLGETAVDAVVLPLSDLQVLTGYGRGPGGHLLDAADTVEVALSGSAATSSPQIASVAKAASQLFPLYGVDTLTQQASQLAQAAAILTAFYLALSSVALTVGLTFLAVVLIRRVDAQRRSIGIRRALGLPGRMIAREVVEDGVLLAATGGLLGVIAGYVVVRLLASYASGAVQEATGLAYFDPVLLSAIVLGVVGLSLIAATAAVRRALRLGITEALR